MDDKHPSASPGLYRQDYAASAEAHGRAAGGEELAAALSVLERLGGGTALARTVFGHASAAGFTPAQAYAIVRWVGRASDPETGEGRPSLRLAAEARALLADAAPSTPTNAH